MNKTKILYVEDEMHLGKIVKESLESRDFEVRMLTDGMNVLPVVEEFKPDICVLDVMLPKKDGFTIGQEIRDRQASLPIIFLTAKNQLQDVHRNIFTYRGHQKKLSTDLLHAYLPPLQLYSYQIPLSWLQYTPPHGMYTDWKQWNLQP